MSDVPTTEFDKIFRDSEREAGNSEWLVPVRLNLEKFGQGNQETPMRMAASKHPTSDKVIKD